MVSIKNLTTGAVYNYPYNSTQVSYSKQVMATTIAIPLSNEPILINYGGDQITLTIDFITQNQPDVLLLTTSFSDASGSIYEVDLSSEWGMPFSGSLATLGSFQGYVTQMNIVQDGGTANVFKCNMVIMIGQPE